MGRGVSSVSMANKAFGMMDIFSNDELSGMQATQEAAMMDTCVLMRYSEMLDAINHPVPTWTDGPSTICGLDMTGGEEQRGSQRVVARWDATIRLPLDTVIDLRDRIRITHRFGQALASGLVYEIAGPAEIGPSGMVTPLKKVVPSV